MPISFAALFAVYLFLHTTTFQLGSHGGAAYLAASQQETLYYLHQACSVLGFLAYPASRRFLHGEGRRRALTAAAMAAYALGAAALFSARDAFAYQYIASAVIFCLGYMGGLVYRRMSDALRGNSHMGISMGAGCAAAYALQFLLQLWRGPSPLLPVVMLAAFVMLADFLFRKPEPSAGEAAADGTETRGGALIVSLTCACVVTTALILLNCFYDGYIERMQVMSGYTAYNAFGWPRLTLVPCFLLFGLLGDVKQGRFVPLAALCAILCTLLNPVLTGVAGAYHLNMCLFYVGVAAAISYYTLTFWRLAPRTRNPALWAGMGRVIDGAAGVAMGWLRFSDNTAPVVIGVEAALLVAVIVALAVNGDLNLAPRGASVSVPVPQEPTADPIAAMRTRYALTERETEVLEKLLLTEGNLQQIAEELLISRRVLQRHITALYQKTGAKSRVGLAQLYREI